MSSRKLTGGPEMDYPHIVKTSDSCGGQPHIQGTDMTVYRIMDKIARGRMTAQEVLIDHPHLTLAQIYAAMAYYCDNRTEVEASARKAAIS
jgi:uncharacterized protein (DUF433 family)